MCTKRVTSILALQKHLSNSDAQYVSHFMDCELVSKQIVHTMQLQAQGVQAELELLEIPQQQFKRAQEGMS